MVVSEVASIVVIIILVLIALILSFIALILKRALIPTESHRIHILKERTKFNLNLIEENNMKILSEFAYSEAAINERFQQRTEVDAIGKIPDKLQNEDDSFLQRCKTWIKENSGTLLGKVNDIAKSAIGLSKSK